MREGDYSCSWRLQHCAQQGICLRDLFFKGDSVTHFLLPARCDCTICDPLLPLLPTSAGERVFSQVATFLPFLLVFQGFLPLLAHSLRIPWEDRLNLRIYTYRAHTPRMGKSRDLYIPSSLSIKRTNQAEKDATPLITSRVRNHIKMLRTAMAMQIIICPGLIVPSTVMDKVPMFIKVCAGYPNCRRRNVSTR